MIVTLSSDDLHLSQAPELSLPDPQDKRLAHRVEFWNGTDTLNADIVIVGVPQHLGVQRNGGRPGAAEAPSSIRNFLYRLTDSWGAKRLPEGVRIVDVGDIRCDDDSLELLHERQYRVVNSLLAAGVFVVCIGGGHDIAWPNGRSFCDQFSSQAIVNVDAHLDVRQLLGSSAGDLAHSGSPFRQILTHNSCSIKAGDFVEFGIQAFCAAASHIAFVESLGHRVLLLDKIKRNATMSAFAQVVSGLSAENLYVSFDIDAVSSAFAPGVSAPAVDGFSADQALMMSLIASSDRRSRMIDFVEVNPKHDQDNRTSRLVAQMIARVIWNRAEISKGDSTD